MFSESHGWEECPDVAPPCGGSESASCAGATIGPITLKSKRYPKACTQGRVPKAAVSYSADNFGFASGMIGQVGCAAHNDCLICDEYGIVTPFETSMPNNEVELSVRAHATNSPHGGPYDLWVYVYFYWEEE